MCHFKCSFHFAVAVYLSCLTYKCCAHLSNLFLPNEKWSLWHDLLGKKPLFLLKLLFGPLWCVHKWYEGNLKGQSRILTFMCELPNQKVTFLTKEVEYNPFHFYILAENREAELMSLVIEKKKTSTFLGPQGGS